jgi:hypothetical protein
MPWRSFLLVAALFVPLSFVASGGGAWIANARGSSQLVIGLIAMQWLYLGVFMLLMLVSFKS